MGLNSGLDTQSGYPLPARNHEGGAQGSTGLMVVGAERNCGKTVASVGLAMALAQEGFRIQVLKPLAFASKPGFHPGLDQDYINKVTQQLMHTDTLALPSPWDVTPVLWNRMREQCKQFQYPCLLEGMGQVSTPWRIRNHAVTDALDLASELNLAILLVIKAGDSCLEEARTALSFIENRKADLAGLIRVYTDSGTENRRGSDLDETMILSQEYRAAFLGDVPFSPSISVERGYHGNLVTLIAENIDLLPLQMKMGLKI